MSLRPGVSGSALRGNPLNIVVIASSRGLGARNDNQSQVTEELRYSIYSRPFSPADTRQTLQKRRKVN